MKRRVVVLAALLALAFPAVASADFALIGRTSQGVSVGFRISSRLLKVKRFVILWRAKCSSGATLFDGSVGSASVRPFPQFFDVGSYKATGLNYSAAQGRSLTFVVSVFLHGNLLRNARLRGTWTAQVRVLDANNNQVDSCHTGLVRWKATLA